MRAPKIALVFLVFLVSAPIAMAATEVTVSGSTTVLPLAEVISEVFNVQQSDYHVSITGGGTGAGITAIAEGRSDLAMASREVTSDETSRYGDKFQESFVGYDSIVIVVSGQVYDAGVKALTKAQIREIYVGNTKNWKDLGGPNEEIYVIAREQSSGTRDTFDDNILGSRSAETPGVSTVANSNAEVATAVTGSNKAIGYVGYNYVRGASMKVVSVDGVLPTFQTIKDGSYGLGRKLYLVSYGNSTQGAKTFINFVLSDQGQRIALENGFIPLNETASSDAGLVTLSAVAPVPVTSAPSSPSSPKFQPGFEAFMALSGIGAAVYLVARKH
jgi:phosphate transport system substrate-binding protein